MSDEYTSWTAVQASYNRRAVGVFFSTQVSKLSMKGFKWQWKAHFNAARAYSQPWWWNQVRAENEIWTAIPTPKKSLPPWNLRTMKLKAGEEIPFSRWSSECFRWSLRFKTLTSLCIMTALLCKTLLYSRTARIRSLRSWLILKRTLGNFTVLNAGALKKTSCDR